MSEFGNTYSKVAAKQNDATKKLVKFGKDFCPFIILILNIVVKVCSRLFNTWLENPFTADFFIQLGTDILTTMFCYATFLKFGVNNEKALSNTFESNLATWGTLSNKVRNGNSDKFIDYCREQVEKEREEKRYAIIQNHTMITIEKYEKEYKIKTVEEIEQLYLDGKLTKKEAKYINKANATHKVRPINPLLILCGVKEGNINNVGREGISTSTLYILSRPVLMFILTALVTMFKGSWVGISDASAIFDMLYSILLIVFSSVIGYTSGADCVRKENDKIKGRIYFLERFIHSQIPQLPQQQVQVNKEQSI